MLKKKRADLNPKPAALPPPPAAALVDPQIKEWMGAMTASVNAALALVGKQAEAKPAAAAAPPPPPPPPAPSEKRAGLVDALRKAKAALPPPAPAPAAPLPLLPEPYAGPVTATIERDKKDRLSTVAVEGACKTTCKVTRDEHGRMQELKITVDGKERCATIARNRQHSIETITLTGA